MSVFLGIDIGTSGTKTLAIDPKGTILASAMETYPCYFPKPLWSEQDPDDWWQATIRSVRKTMAKARLKPADVKAIGLSGQMHGSVFLDKNDKVIRRAILWNDQRTAAECAEMEQRVGGRANLIKLVANPALTGFTAPKILWLRNHEPKHFEKTRKVLLPKDEIRRRLTGEYATEVSDASGMLLLDVAQRTLVEEAALGVGTGHRPAGPVLRIGGSDRPAHAAGGQAAGPYDRLRGGGRGGRLRRRGRGQRHRRQGRALAPRSAPPA